MVKVPKINTRADLLNYAKYYEIRTYASGQIDKIRAYDNDTLRKKLLDETVVTDYNAVADQSDTPYNIKGLLFPEIWEFMQRRQITNWYDRNPLDIVLAKEFVLASPQGIQTIWQYTVPPKRKAFVELCRMNMNQTTVSSGALNGESSVFVVFSPDNFVTFSNSSLVQVLFEEPTPLGTWLTENIGQSMVLQSGASIACNLVSTCVNGTVDYQASAKITEFDA